MDPLLTWQTACRHLAKGQIDEAIWAIEGLIEWLQRNGQRPLEVPSRQTLGGLAAGLTAVARALEQEQHQDESIHG
jgi:hypothetical protein